MNLKNCSTLALAAASISIVGCASTTQSGTSAQAAAAVTEVPALRVIVDCSPCEVKPNIPTLIAEGYSKAAAKDGVKVLASKEATLTIKEYTARNDVARFMVGVFAGKDEIKGLVAYQGKSHAVEDYYSNAWLGIETLAGKVGELTYAKVKQGSQ